MHDTSQIANPSGQPPGNRQVALTSLRILGVLGALYAFLFGLDLMGVAFKVPICSDLVVLGGGVRCLGGVRFGAVWGGDIYFVEYFVVIFGWLVVMVAMLQSFAAHMAKPTNSEWQQKPSPCTIYIKHPGYLFNLHWWHCIYIYTYRYNIYIYYIHISQTANH